jgi:pimeloyl-ACP methyl ester carboxylesterase
VKKLLLSLSCLFFIFQTLCSQTLLTSTFLDHRTKEELIADFNNPLIKNGVDIYKVTYLTPDVQGVSSTASGLLVAPDNFTKIYPLLCYQHGTSSSGTDVPSNQNFESELAVALSGMGYLVAAPDYLGLGDSPGFHPYVHAETEASAAVDMLRAAKAFAAQEELELNEQVFVTGYSQGGHAAMALHRKLELELASEFTVTAASPMSGPYSIGGVMRELILSENEYFYPAYIPNTILSYQLMYGDLYNSIGEVFKPAYAPVITQFQNDEITLTQLNTTLISLLIANEGASVPVNMMQDAMINAIVSDPNHPFNAALNDNDVYDWAPTAPTRLVYCTADDQVPFENAILAGSVMNANGATEVVSYNADPNADHVGCVFPATFFTILFFSTFQQLDDVTTATTNVTAGELELSPNPASDAVYLKNLPAEGTLLLRNMNGKILRSFKAGANDVEISLSDIPPGLYVVQLVGQNQTWVNKLVVR